MKKICKKCNKQWEVKSHSDHGRASQTSLFCRSCAASYSGGGGRNGKSLIDEYLQEQLSYYNPNGPYILKCKCGNKQTYHSKYMLVRVLQTTGECGKCSRHSKRKPHGPRSEQQIKNNRLLRIRELGFNSIEEYEHNIFVMGKPKRYYANIDSISRTNLKREKPELYKLWDENKWDGTDDSQLTIEHTIPKSLSWKERIPIEEVAHIDNLEVITMRENNERWNNINH